MKQLFAVYHSLGPYKKTSFAVAVLMISSALTESIGLGLLLPALELMINDKSNHSLFLNFLNPLLQFVPERHTVSVILLSFLCLTILKNASRMALSFYTAKLVTGTYTMWFKNIFKNYMDLQLIRFSKNKQGEMFNNMTIEPGKAAQAANDILEMFSRVCIIICVLTVLFLSSWQTTLFACLLFGMLFIFTHKASQRYSSAVGETLMKCRQDFHAVGAEGLSAFRAVKILDLYENRLHFVDRLLKKYRDIGVRFEFISKSPFSVAEILIVMAAIGIAIYINSFSSTLKIKEFIPILGLFIIAARPLINSVSTLATLRMTIANNLPALKLVDFLSRDQSCLEKRDLGESIQRLQSDIVIKNLTFSYDKEKPIFKNLSWEIVKNKTTALIGPSGIGKSTLLDLILGLLSADGGEIIVNGKFLNQYNLRDWRRTVGYIDQGTFLFHTTVHENILFGNPDAANKVMEVAKQANAHDFIMSLPKGYDTIIGDRGDQLSGGQKQKIAIARAIIKDADFYIFDEPTSALDAKSEDEIIKMIVQLRKANKTVLIISHRFNLVKDADAIYELKNGQIFLQQPRFEGIPEKSYDI